MVAQASNFGEGFRLFALVVLPVVLFIGIGTLLRLDSANNHDSTCVVGMNRIRAAYMELAPDLVHYFVMGTTDDQRGIEMTMALRPGQSFAAIVLGATPFLVAVLNVVLVAAIAALLAVQLGASTALALAIGVAGFVLGMLVYAWYTNRLLGRIIRDYRPKFPSREGMPGLDR